MTTDGRQPDDIRLANEIRSRRRQLNLSMRDLAGETGLSPTLISQLERGIANPTLGSLRKLANALDTTILRLLGAPPERSPVVRHNQRLQMKIPPGGITIELFNPDLNRKMALFQIRATAEAGNLVRQPLRESTEECIVVMEGTFKITIAGHTYDLEPGDSAYFEGRDLEALHVVSSGNARFISAITPPVW
jgi:transcriptional regulator with XRE-family HTH domain